MSVCVIVYESFQYSQTTDRIFGRNENEPEVIDLEDNGLPPPEIERQDLDLNESEPEIVENDHDDPIGDFFHIQNSPGPNVPSQGSSNHGSQRSERNLSQSSFAIHNRPRRGTAFNCSSNFMNGRYIILEARPVTEDQPVGQCCICQAR